MSEEKLQKKEAKVIYSEKLGVESTLGKGESPTRKELPRYEKLRNMRKKDVSKLSLLLGNMKE